MSLRFISQWITYLFSIAIFGIALAGIYVRPDRRWWLGIAIMYALLDIIFYTIVLVFHLGVWGNTLSPYRSVMQDSIVLAMIFAILRGDLKSWLASWK